LGVSGESEISKKKQKLQKKYFEKKCRSRGAAEEPAGCELAHPYSLSEEERGGKKIHLEKTDSKCREKTRQLKAEIREYGHHQKTQESTVKGAGGVGRGGVKKGGDNKKRGQTDALTHGS